MIIAAILFGAGWGARLLRALGIKNPTVAVFVFSVIATPPAIAALLIGVPLSVAILVCSCWAMTCWLVMKMMGARDEAIGWAVIVYKVTSVPAAVLLSAWVTQLREVP